jgi:hypothetical protein
VAGELGFEPRQTESESVVLPLHHSPKFHNNINALIACCAVVRGRCGNPFRCGAVLLAPSRAWQARAARRERAATPSLADGYCDKARRQFVFARPLSRDRRRHQAAKPLASQPSRPACPQGKPRRRRLWANLPLQTRHAMLRTQKITEKAGQRRLKRVRPDAW